MSFFKQHSRYGRTLNFDGQRLIDIGVSVDALNLQDLYSEGIYHTYVIEDGERPDTLALKLYDSQEYDWIVLLINDIHDIRNEWPLSDVEFNAFLKEKYAGGAALDNVYYYTDKYDNIFTDITLNNNQQIVKIGDEEDAAAIRKIIDDRGLKAVTYREHENNVNHAKRMIQVLDPQYMPAFVLHVNNLLAQ